MTPNKDLVEKIRSILNRAEEGRGATDEERDTAMKMAEKLLFKHNLSMADVEAAGLQEARPVSQHVGLEEEPDHWKGTLLWGIAKVFFCHVYYGHPSHLPPGDRKRNYYVIGREDNVSAVKDLQAYVAQQIDGRAAIEVAARGQLPRYARVSILRYAERMTGRSLEEDEQSPDVIESWREELVPRLAGDEGLELIMELTGLTKAYASEIRPYIKKNRVAPEVVPDLAVWRRSFTDGMVRRVIKRLEKMHAETVCEEGSKGTDLVKNETAELDQFMENVLGMARKDGKGSRRLDDQSARLAGRQAGDRVDVNLRSKVGVGGANLLGSGS